jgi:hypothetical protein
LKHIGDDPVQWKREMPVSRRSNHKIAFAIVRRFASKDVNF